MATQPTPSGSSHNLDAVLRLISDLARKSAEGSYIYRGEHAAYCKVSSSLYRKYKDIDEEGSTIGAIQEEILEQAKAHSPDTNDVDIEILAELRHNGGDTNLIDFTSDYLIALFFACDGAPDKQGQIHLLSKIGDHYDIHEPRNPLHRALAQKSVIVMPDKGFVIPKETLPIDAGVKPEVLEYLRARHGISSETIYNDPYGVIQYQAVHQAAYDAFYRGVILASRGNSEEAILYYTDCIERNPEMASAYSKRADAYHELGEYDSEILDYQKALTFNVRNANVYHNLGVAYAAKRDYHSAIQHYDQALQLGPNAYTRYHRFEARLLLNQWEKAKQAAISVYAGWEEITAIFKEFYESVSDFEEKNDIELPDDIVGLLGGR